MFFFCCCVSINFVLKTALGFFSSFFLLKNGLFSRSACWIFCLLFNLLSWGCTNSIYTQDTLSFLIFRFIYCVKKIGHIFDLFKYFHIFRYCKKADTLREGLKQNMSFYPHFVDKGGGKYMDRFYCPNSNFRWKHAC